MKKPIKDGWTSEQPSLVPVRRKQTLLARAKVKQLAAFQADTFHSWQEEYWGAQGKKLSRYEYRRGFELAIEEALERVQFGEITWSMNKA